MRLAYLLLLRPRRAHLFGFFIADRERQAEVAGVEQVGVEGISRDRIAPRSALYTDRSLKLVSTRRSDMRTER